MSKFLNGFLTSLFFWILNLIQGKFIRSLKIEAVKAYIGLVGAARRLGILWTVAAAVVLLSTIGFIMINLGVLYLLHLVGLRWTIGWLLLGLGLAYFASGLIALNYIFSEKTWLRHSRALEFLDKISRKD